MNRRTFVTSLAAAGAVATAPRRLLAQVTAPRPRVGVIGAGWYGGVNLGVFARCTAVDFVSLCDVNTRSLTTTLKLVAEHQAAVPRTFADYREMLAAGGHDIVIIATPDHWHALPALAAMQAGADVYLEKPVSVDVIEGEALVAAARKYGRVVQVNTQRRSNPLYAEARDKYITSGRLGRISLVETYSYLHGRPTGIIPDAPVPAHLDYETWAGPAPKLPYKAMLADRGWRNFQEYGNGQIGDLGVHMIDKVRWLLGLHWPDSIVSTGGILADVPPYSATITDTQRSVFRYPGLDVSWEHRTWGASPIPARHWSDQWGARLIGTKGTLNLTMLEAVFTPADGGPREGRHLHSPTGNLENIDFNWGGHTYEETENRHVLDFMAARAARSRPVADIEEGHISSAMCELANLSLQLRRPIAYDPATRTVPGDAEATRLLARPYRGPWVHPDPTTV
ncbi:Inositol 2-dehydrogenase [Lacunisphaera limnophila]|uniref:Inositol 2-dehydrogenase n=1 Tax=Lacunisphaera limnophila TaxID=1838286 RepID=A0A1D8AYH1_9BACT|nr:Gfo/Idh/MocA family oxidoreductase [Lacunisphaera limnophila]AOS45940.1 Inositol 2-dehydrogenase [Lacunisphaera limnophila]